MHESSSANCHIGTMPMTQFYWQDEGANFSAFLLDVMLGADSDDQGQNI